MTKLPDHKAFELLRKFKIPAAEYKLVKTAEQAEKVCEDFGFPCVLKIDAEIIHKAKAGTVKIVEKPEDVTKSFETIMKNAKKQLKITSKVVEEQSSSGSRKAKRFPKTSKKIDGIIVQQFVKGKELIIGGKRDPQFGTILLFGSGGTLAEVMKDVAFRVLPMGKFDAEMMVQETKAYIAYEELQQPKTMASVTNLLHSVGRMLESNPKIKELDINPVMLTPKGLVAVDVRIIV